MKNHDVQAVALARQGLSPTRIAEVLGRDKEMAFRMTFDQGFRGSMERAVQKHEKDLEDSAEELEFSFKDEAKKLAPLAAQTCKELLEYGENEAVRAKLLMYIGDIDRGKGESGSIAFSVNELNVRLENAHKRAEENFITVDSY